MQPGREVAAGMEPPPESGASLEGETKQSARREGSDLIQAGGGSRGGKGLTGVGGGGGAKSGFLPSSFRMISSYLRTVSLNADTIVSTVRSATASVASAISPADDRQQREQVGVLT